MNKKCWSWIIKKHSSMPDDAKALISIVDHGMAYGAPASASIYKLPCRYREILDDLHDEGFLDWSEDDSEWVAVELTMIGWILFMASRMELYRKRIERMRKWENEGRLVK